MTRGDDTLASQEDQVGTAMARLHDALFGQNGMLDQEDDSKWGDVEEAAREGNDRDQEVTAVVIEQIADQIRPVDEKDRIEWLRRNITADIEGDEDDQSGDNTAEKRLQEYEYKVDSQLGEDQTKTQQQQVEELRQCIQTSIESLGQRLERLKSPEFGSAHSAAARRLGVENAAKSRREKLDERRKEVEKLRESVGKLREQLDGSERSTAARRDRLAFMAKTVEKLTERRDAFRANAEQSIRSAAEARSRHEQLCDDTVKVADKLAQAKETCKKQKELLALELRKAREATMECGHRAKEMRAQQQSSRRPDFETVEASVKLQGRAHEVRQVCEKRDILA